MDNYGIFSKIFYANFNDIILTCLIQAKYPGSRAAFKKDFQNVKYNYRSVKCTVEIRTHKTQLVHLASLAK